MNNLLAIECINYE